MSKARWAGYAAAGAAAMFGSQKAADAGITHVVFDPSIRLDACHDGYSSYDIDFNGDGDLDLRMQHKSLTQSVGAAAAYGIHGDDEIVGETIYYGGFPFFFAANLTPGTLVNDKAFIGQGFMALYYGGYGSHFQQRDIGYLGFQFGAADGTHYGWLRVQMDGIVHNAYSLIDYAYAGVGEDIRVGQVPEPGSLGLLATGALGLLMWRRARRGKKPTA